MKKLILIFLLLNIVSCNDSKTNNDSKNKIDVTNTESNEVNYKILKETKYEGIRKVNIEIKLEAPITKEQLTDIALKLKEDREDFDKLFIFYFLSENGNEIGQGAWATTHFHPDLNVEILGPTKESLIELESKKVSGKVIGIWRDNNEILTSKIFLVEENKKLLIKTVYAKSHYMDSSELVDEVIKKIQNGLVKLDLENVHGEYYIIEENGNLGLYKRGEKFGDFNKVK